MKPSDTKSPLIVKPRRRTRRLQQPYSPNLIWQGDTYEFLCSLPDEPIFDFVVTSPPYNIGKSYEQHRDLKAYLAWQRKIIEAIIVRLKPNASICWQVGNFVENGEIVPLDIELHPIFRDARMKLRNRIVWRFGHGLHGTRRFSGRYEVVMWYTNGDRYTFNLDAVRVPSKYPGKKHYKGEKKGQFSSHPFGKNPEDIWDMDLDVWDIPNVKGNHVEKTPHPCQYPVGLAERLILALTKPDALIFDPFFGVGTTGVAATLNNRRYWGCEQLPLYVQLAKSRILKAQKNELKFRPHDRPIYDHTKSKLSIPPNRTTGQPTN